MIDPLFEHSRLAIAESRLLKQQRKMLRQQFETRPGPYGPTVLASAMDRSDRMTVLDDKR